MVLLLPFSRHQRDMDRWLRQVSTQEARVAEDAHLCNQILVQVKEGKAEPEALEVALDERFPMHTRACDYPGKCPMQGICFDEAVAEDPIASKLFRWREPHHEPEREEMERRAA